MRKKRFTTSTSTPKVVHDPADTCRQLKCTFIKTVILNNELEICFRISLSDDIENLCSFISPENVSVAFESLNFSDRKCLCLGCGCEQIVPLKGLVLRVNQGVQSCSNCLKLKDGDSSPSKQSRTATNDTDDNSKCSMLQGVQKSERKEISSKRSKNDEIVEASEDATKVDQLIVEKGDEEVAEKRPRLRKVKVNLQPTDNSNADLEDNEADNDKIYDEDFPVKKRRSIRTKRKFSNSEPCVCTTCGKQLRNAKSLKGHMTTHQPSDVHKCDICQHKFTQLRYLKKHKRTHISEKPYVCDICGQRFKLKESLPKHKILHSELKPFKCNVCDKDFHLKDQLAKHVHVHTKERNFICNLCGKAFRTRGSMKSHENTHEGPLMHHCDQCGKSYRSVWYLKIHMKTHTGENLIQCHACGDWFIDPCYFKLHQKRFCKGNPLACSVCQMEFPHYQALHSHMGMHSGERPHQCNTCGKAFAKVSRLNEHRKRHTLENCHKCQFCRKGFINNKELKRHEKSHLKQKKRAHLPERLKPGRVEVEDDDDIQIANFRLEVLAEPQNKTDQISVPTYLESLPPESTDSASRTQGYDCLRYVPVPVSDPNLLTVSSDTSIPAKQETDPTGADCHHVMVSLGGTDYNPVCPRQDQCRGAESHSFDCAVPQQSGIISTSEGEQLLQLRPVGSSADENETSVQQLIHAAALIKSNNYISQL